MILIGHGAVPADFPRELAGELKRLESARGADPPSSRETELDRRMRSWPRTPKTDPYQAGLESIARSLGSALKSRRVVCAYNEFCGPTIEEAVRALAAAGASSIVLLSIMITRGGVHSEHDIPAVVDRLRREHAGVPIRYAWPYHLPAVARMLADSVRRAESTRKSPRR